jgi:hypothetical protein
MTSRQLYLDYRAPFGPVQCDDASGVGVHERCDDRQAEAAAGRSR